MERGKVFPCVPIVVLFVSHLRYKRRMSAHIDPIILQKLQAFARRRRALILIRGIFAAVAMLVGTMVVVAAVDFWIPFLSNGVRWTLSNLRVRSESNASS